MLLALCVALVNAGNGLTALWILLCCVGFMLLLMFLVKPFLVWLLRRTGSLDSGPSQSIISLILLIALASAFFTAIIGVHAIFGGFMAGLIIPRHNHFNIRVTEKLEDLIGAIFLPLYFTLSGLNTNLGLLDSGTAWGYVFATTAVALLSKIIGASVAARLNGLVWRESLTIGVLMSCKGLVELIVLVRCPGPGVAAVKLTVPRILVSRPTFLARAPLLYSSSWLSSPPLPRRPSCRSSTRPGIRKSWRRGSVAKLTGTRARPLPQRPTLTHPPRGRRQ